MYVAKSAPFCQTVNMIDWVVLKSEVCLFSAQIMCTVLLSVVVLVCVCVCVCFSFWENFEITDMSWSSGRSAIPSFIVHGSELI